MMSCPPIAVFDLDGTLADTIHDLIATLNTVLEDEGLPPLSLAEGRAMVGAGARALIERGRPALAVCLYHRPGHLWEIPLLLHSWSIGYKFYLRAYAANGFEWVLYAVADTEN